MTKLQADFLHRSAAQFKVLRRTGNRPEPETPVEGQSPLVPAEHPQQNLGVAFLAQRGECARQEGSADLLPPASRRDVKRPDLALRGDCVLLAPGSEVDEADLVKTDGARIVSVVTGVLRVTVLDDAPAVDGSLDLSMRAATELFLRGDTALVIGSAYSGVTPMVTVLVVLPPLPSLMVTVKLSLPLKSLAGV